MKMLNRFGFCLFILFSQINLPAQTDLSNIIEPEKYDIPISINTLPKIGDVLNDSIVSKHSGFASYVNSSSILDALKVRNNGLIYIISWNQENKLVYISTTDMNFSTSEKVKVAMTLKDLKKIQKVEVKKMRGWGYYVLLNSGWQVGFCAGSSCTDRELNNDDKIMWIFKR